MQYKIVDRLMLVIEKYLLKENVEISNDDIAVLRVVIEEMLINYEKENLKWD